MFSSACKCRRAHTRPPSFSLLLACGCACAPAFVYLARFHWLHGTHQCKLCYRELVRVMLNTVVSLHEQALKSLISPRTKLVAVVWVSNMLGAVTHVHDVVAEAQKVGFRFFLGLKAMHASTWLANSMPSCSCFSCWMKSWCLTIFNCFWLDSNQCACYERDHCFAHESNTVRVASCLCSYTSCACLAQRLNSRVMPSLLTA